MFKQRLAGGVALLLLGTAATLLTTSTAQAQVFNTIAVNAPHGFIFYTFPANYYPYFVPVNDWGYGGGPFGFGPDAYPYGTFATTLDLLPERRGAAAAAPRANGAAPMAANTTATVELLVPPDAQVWIEGKKMKQHGTVRRFVSPPLDPRQTYTYDFRVRWTENGRRVSRHQQVVVRAGDQQRVSFPLALAAGANSEPKTLAGK